MQIFVWDDSFETGLNSVDSQHRRLVELINLTGEELAKGQPDDQHLGELFQKLTEYAQYHFTEEERLMRETGVDERHVAPHQRHHAEFVQQIVHMSKDQTGADISATHVHDYLVNWLTAHILGEDQALSRNIQFIQAGRSAAEAYESAQATAPGRNDILIGAMHRLYRQLAEKNRELEARNEALEAKVQSRTRELLQSEKHASVGRLAAGIAHEINTPLGYLGANLRSLKGYANSLLTVIDACAASGGNRLAFEQAASQADLDFIRQDLSALLDESFSGVGRISEIVDKLRGFSRVDEAQLQDVNINRCVEDSLQVAAHALDGRITVTRHYAALPLLRSLPVQINQVFYNLIVNAAQSMDGTGTLSVTSRVNGDWIEVAFTDSGKGLSNETLAKIFDPFFTTLPVGKGAGLGLTEAYDIVKKCGGRIDVASEPGRGSTFCVALPVQGPVHPS